MQPVFDHCILGETDEVMMVETRKENSQATLSMTQQSRYHIDILSRDLDPHIYNTTEFLQAIRGFVLQHRRTRLRILLYDLKEIVRKGHRLIDMAGNLSSFIQLRTPKAEASHCNESLFIADGTGYIHTLHAHRYDATINFADKSIAKYLLRQFNALWETATPDSNTRKFHL